MDNSSGGENNIWLFLSLIIIGGGLFYGLTGGDKASEVQPVNTNSVQQENVVAQPVNSAALEVGTSTKEQAEN